MFTSSSSYILVLLTAAVATTAEAVSARNDEAAADKLRRKLITRKYNTKLNGLFPYTKVIPEYLEKDGGGIRASAGEEVENIREEDDSQTESYVFLQRFPLMHTGGLLFHTEVLVCPRDNFTEVDQTYLNDLIHNLEDFTQIQDEWWQSHSTTHCVELGYGGSSCTDECCSVPHKSDQLDYPLNAQRAMISNADTSHKQLYLYGTSSFGGDTAYHHACDAKCWSNWSGTDYNPLTNNCNTFTSTVLSCVMGLSQKKPHLGPSDMVEVTCHCEDEAYNMG